MSKPCRGDDDDWRKEAVAMVADVNTMEVFDFLKLMGSAAGGGEREEEEESAAQSSTS